MVEKVFSEKDLRIQPINVINRQNRRGCDKGVFKWARPCCPPVRHWLPSDCHPWKNYRWSWEVHHNRQEKRENRLRHGCSRCPISIAIIVLEAGGRIGKNILLQIDEQDRILTHRALVQDLQHFEHFKKATFNRLREFQLPRKITIWEYYERKRILHRSLR